MTRTVKSENRWDEVVLHAWGSSAYKKLLVKDPIAALKECGVHIDPKVKVHVHEQKDGELLLVLPDKLSPVAQKKLLVNGGYSVNDTFSDGLTTTRIHASLPQTEGVTIAISGSTVSADEGSGTPPGMAGMF